MSVATILSAAWVLGGCRTDDPSKRAQQPPTESTASTTPPAGCLTESFAVGDDQGHPDVFGAAAAGQARAARIDDVADLPQPAHGRQRIENGDFVLANDRIAVVVEDRDVSDGYGRFGGEILAVDLVGADGRPVGASRYVETLLSIGLMVANPSSVSVLSDGSDGGEAIVRVIGETQPVPFLDGPIASLFEGLRPLQVALDYVLAPGSPAIVVRFSVANDTEEALDLGEIEAGSDEIFAFFQSNHNQIFSPEHGFDPRGSVSWLGFVNEGAAGFAWRPMDGALSFGLEVSGFAWVNGPGWLAPACAITASDRVQIVVGGPEVDGLRAVVREVDGEVGWRVVAGTVVDAEGEPVSGALVHQTEVDGSYVSRTRTASDGTFTIHAPTDRTVRLTAQSRGHVHEGADLAPEAEAIALTFEPHGRIHVAATASDGRPLPVRVQVIPSAPLPGTPDAWGARDEANGRLHQAFVMDGDETLIVGPGEHRVVVSRGYEWELHDETVSVAAGQTAEIAAVLEHSVGPDGVMCADFHIHSIQSADSSDPVAHKVKGAIADGLDIPVSSEHEWIVDFGPVIADLGLRDWAYGMPSSELTTFSFGHFGVVPLLPQPEALNNGAIDWIGRSPAEVFDLVDARPEQPALIVNHPSDGSFGSYLSTVGIDPISGEPLDPTLWSDDFDALEVFNDSTLDENRTGSVADWFALLNRGHRFSAVGNSDSHSIRSSPVGYPRTCFSFGHDDPRRLTHDAVRDAIVAGSGVISGGLLLTVAGPDGEGPGDTLGAGVHTFDVTIAASSWVEASELEVIVGGETSSTTPLDPIGTGPGNRYQDRVEVPLESGEWVVFHVRGAGDLSPLHPGRAPFAVSNPIWAE